MKNNPCHNCKERYVGCHSNCQEYAEYRNELNKIKAKKKATKDLELNIKDIHVKAITKTLKRKRSHKY